MGRESGYWEVLVSMLDQRGIVEAYREVVDWVVDIMRRYVEVRRVGFRRIS